MCPTTPYRGTRTPFVGIDPCSLARQSRLGMLIPRDVAERSKDLHVIKRETETKTKNERREFHSEVPDTNNPIYTLSYMPTFYTVVTLVLLATTNSPTVEIGTPPIISNTATGAVKSLLIQFRSSTAIKESTP